MAKTMYKQEKVNKSQNKRKLYIGHILYARVRINVP